MGSHSLLQETFPTHWSNLSLLHCRWTLYHLSYQGNPMKVKITLCPTVLMQPLLKYWSLFPFTWTCIISCCRHTALSTNLNRAPDATQKFYFSSSFSTRTCHTLPCPFQSLALCFLCSFWITHPHMLKHPDSHSHKNAHSLFGFVNTIRIQY